ncbi:hypothetical protein E4U19_006862, partial [Claviceps sp. Clav32 group G5]
MYSSTKRCGKQPVIPANSLFLLQIASDGRSGDGDSPGKTCSFTLQKGPQPPSERM